MIIPSGDPREPGKLPLRTMVIVGLLVAAAAFAGRASLFGNVDQLALEEAEQHCGKGNALKTGEVSYICADEEKPE